MNEWILIITLAGGMDGGAAVQQIPNFPTRDSCMKAATFWSEQWYARREHKWTNDYVRASGFAICVERPALKK